MRISLLAAPLFMIASAQAKAPHWQETLDSDLQGPRVEWVGEIIGRVSDDGYTCFILERPRETKYIACNPGYFAFDDFAPGAWLKAVGNLGAAVPREIGGQVYDLPLVAGALVTKASPRPYYDPYYYGYDHRPYYGYPFYDPFYGPFYGPRFGSGIFFHFH
ncbi:MAG: hypothetical protein ACREV9_07535 [Burkholderiales bacterium]